MQSADQLLIDLFQSVLEESISFSTTRTGDCELVIEPGDIHLTVSEGDFKLDSSKRTIDSEFTQWFFEALSLRTKDIAKPNLRDAETWNKWRRETKWLRRVKIDLSGAELPKRDLRQFDLQGVNLSGANLNEADLREANLNSSILQGASLRRAKLQRAKLRFANFREADLQSADISHTNLGQVTLSGANLSKCDLRNTNLSQATIDRKSIFKGAKGIQVGINGVYNRDTDSAAIFSILAESNSMRGPSAQAVIDSLKRARQFLSFSLLVTALTFVSEHLDLSQISLPLIDDLTVPTDDFVLFALATSITCTMLSKLFSNDALEGLRFIQDRSSVMQVAAFPWVISRFAGYKQPEKAISFAARATLALHPVLFFSAMAKPPLDGSDLVQYTLVSIAVLTGLWLLIGSSRFQLPILFDRQTEEEKESRTSRNRGLLESLQEEVRNLKKDPSRGL